MKNFAAALLIVLASEVAGEPVPYKAEWKSLEKYSAPDWYRDAKFGIFIHWGPYAVPAAFNEWYPRNMYQPHFDEYDYHRKTWGGAETFGYKEFIPLFKGEKWDPGAWARLFKKAGARWVMPVGEHHDSFAMYRSSHTRWNCVDMGPGRDVVGELAKALRKEGLKLGVSSHLAFNWWYFPKNRHFDTGDKELADLYGGHHDVADKVVKLPDAQRWEFFKNKERPDKKFLNLWWKRTTEIVDSYKPDLMYFDWGWAQKDWDRLRPKFAAYYYNRAQKWNKGVVLNYKDEAFPAGCAVQTIERGRLSEIQAEPWQTDTSVSWGSWCHIKNDRFKSTKSLVHVLADVVSKNGNFLLNVGPRADGTIALQAEKILLGMGEWLETNGEAIYSTRPWKIYGEGPTGIKAGGYNEGKDPGYTAKDIRFTTRGKAVYAIVMGRPGKTIKIKSANTGAISVTKVGLLGSKINVNFTQDENGLVLSGKWPQSLKHAFVFKLEEIK